MKGQALAIWLNDLHVATVERERKGRLRLQKADRVTTERIVNEAVVWGMRRERAQDLVLDLLDRLPGAIGVAAEQTVGVPEALIHLVSARTESLRGATNAAS